MRRSLAARIVSIWVALISVACGGPAQSARLPRPAGLLRSPADYPADFTIDQRVTATFRAPGQDEEQQSFRAVLEKRGDTLVMVGLAPHGGRAFVLTQHGTDVTFESHLPRELPFPPEHMLLDVHRAWLVGLPGAPLADGEHRGTIDQEELIETWADGRLRSRSFRRLDDAPPGLVAITYEGGLDPRLDAPPPTRVVLENGWYGYRLELDALTRRPLAP